MGCSHTDLSAGTPMAATINTGYRPKIALNGGKIYVVTQNGGNGNRPSLFRCVSRPRCNLARPQSRCTTESGWIRL